MPRGFSSKRKGAGTDTLERPSDESTSTENDVSTATATDYDETTAEDQDSPQFEIVSEPAPADYSPERKTPGRQRRPSVFDDLLRSGSVFEQGWQRVPVSSEEHRAYVLRELNRAKLYLNGTGKVDGESEIGLDLDPTKTDAVYYKSRVAQKRERKSNGNEALAANAAEDGYVDPDGDNDE